MSHPLSENLYVIDHPLIHHKLSLLRDENSGIKLFRECVDEISLLLTYEATRNFKLEEIEVKTPLQTTICKHLPENSVAVIPILRAGLGMVHGLLSYLPVAKVGHIGLYRDEESLEPVEYYCKLPKNISEMKVIVVDPMLATGGSVSKAIQILKDKGASDIIFMCLLASPEGVNYLTKEHPDIQIYTAALDEKLNEKGYILPGLGDAGDRLYGTK